MKAYSLLGLFLCLSYAVQAQVIVTGNVIDAQEKPLIGVNIHVAGEKSGTVTRDRGVYTFQLPSDTDIILVFTHVGYDTIKRKVRGIDGEKITINVTLTDTYRILKGVKVEDWEDIRMRVSITRIDPKTVDLLPNPFSDFTKILATLPGVFSNNELSSSYSVRGGSYDENLVYVNDIPVYRPFLVSNGQQEGLSFVNPKLVSSVTFSAGGWQPKYGDKLSSVLNVTYKQPEDFGASATVGLLGGGLHVEGVTKNQRISYVTGIRHKASQYLLNTLETKGTYRPKFTDIQNYINFNLGKDNNPARTTLGVLMSYAANRYLVEPEDRETEFGTFNQSLRLFVAFDGQEKLEYDSYQGGINLKHLVNERFTTQLIISGIYTTEREFTDIEGGYLLCDVDKNVGSNTFNKCVVIRGIGANYNYGRNILKADIVNAESKNSYSINSTNTLQFGLGYSIQSIDDQLNEYSFRDSADYVTDIVTANADHEIKAIQYTGYVQNTTLLSPQVTTTYGARFNYRDDTHQWLLSPRVQVAWRPSWKRDIVFNGAVGLYAQPPFYREFRDKSGLLNRDLKAQKSLHIIGGMDYNLKWWGRDFNFVGELYYKKMDDVIAYDVDDVRIRYYANNDSKAYAMGADFRLSGEFIDGVESWFSLGVLSTREDVAGDDKGYIRRPTDQRVNVAIFFQDHLPTNPDVRVHLNLLYGSGLPFGPPRDFKNRNLFNGDSYKRVDVGFSRFIALNKAKYNGKRHLLLTAEVLNLLGSNNAISYTWIADVNDDEFAVPNSLSARFLNIKVAFGL